jgi:hypothetical protein
MHMLHGLDLAVTYFLCILGASGFSALLPAMQVALGASTAQATSLVAIASISQAAGKLLFSGWFVHSCGARFAATLSLLAMAASATALSAANSFLEVQLWAAVTDFFLTVAWPAHVQLVRSCSQSIDLESSALWKLGIASRSGAILAQLVFGLSERHYGWRAAQLSSGMLAALGALLMRQSNMRYCRRSGELISTSGGPASRDAEEASPSADSPRPSGGTLCSSSVVPTLRLMASDPQFWLAALGNTLLGAVKLTSQIVLSIYLRDQATPGLVSNGFAIQLAASFSIGVALSVLLGGYMFARASARGKVSLVNLLNAISATAFAVAALDGQNMSAHLAHIWARAALFCVGGWGIGLSFYLPPGLFAIHFGGTNASVVSAYLDGLGYLGAAAASLLTQAIASSSAGWAGVWAFCALMYCAGAICTSVYLSKMLSRYSM